MPILKNMWDYAIINCSWINASLKIDFLRLKYPHLIYPDQSIKKHGWARGEGWRRLKRLKIDELARPGLITSSQKVFVSKSNCKSRYYRWEFFLTSDKTALKIKQTTGKQRLKKQSSLLKKSISKCTLFSDHG